MQLTVRTIFLLLAVNHVLCGVESNKPVESESISPTKYGLLHYAKLKLQSLIAKLTEFTEEVQSLLTSVLEGLGERVNADELRLVVAVWRHGSRAPVADAFNLSDDQLALHWPNGLRGLTKKGIQEQRLLGEFLHERYKEFMMANYSSETVYIESSDSNRTVASALALLSAFIPSTPEQRASSRYYEIPIHKAVHKYDRTLDVVYANCEPPYRPPIMLPPTERTTTESNKELIQIVEKGIGRKLEIMELFLFADSITCYISMIHRERSILPAGGRLRTLERFCSNQYDNKTTLLPQWAQPPLGEKLKKMLDASMLALHMNPEYRRLRGSNLFKRISDDFTDKTVQAKDNTLKFIGYSTHDMTLLALLTDWGALAPELIPDFSSCIMVELYERASQHYVEIWYRTGHGKKLVQLKVNGCAEPCKLQDFARIAEKYASVDITADCEKFKEQGLTYVEPTYN